MAHYFLKANLNGVEIEFNTKDKSIVQSQLDEYFELITGKSCSSRVFETKPKEAKPQFESFEGFKFNTENFNQETPQAHEIESKAPAFSFDSYENQKNDETQEQKPAEIQENTNLTTEAKESPTSFKDIFEAKSADLNEQSSVEYENIEIQKESIVVEKQAPVLDLYQPKKTPELPEFMHNKISNGIFDDFIITAYFIKNVLNEKKFTIKYLNSKLYRAKEKLVDFAILNESITRGLIQALDTTEYGKEYCLTEAGDNYYLGLENK